MWNYLGDLALMRAESLMNRWAEAAQGSDAAHNFCDRSNAWHDFALWLYGLLSWAKVRERRRGRNARRRAWSGKAHSDAVVPIAIAFTIMLAIFLISAVLALVLPLRGAKP